LVVRQGGAEWIVEDGDCLVKADAVLLQVGGGLGWVELEVESREWHREVVRAILTRAEAVAMSA
jgi:hypothetical protein